MRALGPVWLLVLTVAAAGCGGGAASIADAAVDGLAADAGPAGDGAPDGPAALTDLARLRALVAALPGAAPGDRDALVDAFVTTVAYGAHGFPIHEAGELGVVLRDTGGGQLTVAGDFNAWDAAGLPLLQPVAGYGLFYLITPVTEPLPRTLYKLVRNTTDYFADPLARRYGFDQYGEFSLAEAGDSPSHLERWPGFAQGVGTLDPRDVSVYVPAGYTSSTAALPVLYLHDGQNLFDPNAAWGGWHVGDAADACTASATCADLLIVGVDNTAARMDEYTHTQELVSGVATGGRGGEYVAFLTAGVKPFVDGRYRTLPGAATTGVAGSSLGGLISFYAAYLHPEVFGHAASLSGTFFWGSGLGNPTMQQLYTARPPHGVGLYLDSGGNPPCPSPDAESNDNYCETLDLATALRGLGWVDGTDLAYRWSAGAQHNEAAWAARFPGVLTDWFPGP